MRDGYFYFPLVSHIYMLILVLIAAAVSNPSLKAETTAEMNP